MIKIGLLERGKLMTQRGILEAVVWKNESKQKMFVNPLWETGIVITCIDISDSGGTVPRKP